MKPLQNLILLTSLFAFCSCSNVVYHEIVPKGGKTLSSFPSELQGDWLDPNNDTLHIFSDNYKYGSGEDEKSSFFEGELSQNIVLKKYKGYYFLNINEEKKYWEMIAGQVDGDKLYLLSIEMDDIDQVQILNSYLHGKDAKSIKSNNSLSQDQIFIINPKDRELIKLLKNETICDTSVFIKVK